MPELCRMILDVDTYAARSCHSRVRGYWIHTPHVAQGGSIGAEASRLITHAPHPASPRKRRGEGTASRSSVRMRPKCHLVGGSASATIPEPTGIPAGDYFLKAEDSTGAYLAQSVVFQLD